MKSRLVAGALAVGSLLAVAPFTGSRASAVTNNVTAQAQWSDGPVETRVYYGPSYWDPNQQMLDAYVNDRVTGDECRNNGPGVFQTDAALATATLDTTMGCGHWDWTTYQWVSSTRRLHVEWTGQGVPQLAPGSFENVQSGQSPTGAGTFVNARGGFGMSRDALAVATLGAVELGETADTSLRRSTTVAENIEG